MTESLVYYHPVTGAGLELNDGVVFKLLQHEGFGIGDFQHFSTAIPERHGELWHGLRLGVKIITVDLLIYAGALGLAGLENNKRKLMAQVNPLVVDRRGGQVGKLRLTQENGTARQMDCILSDAVPLPTSAHIAKRAARYQIRFRSVDTPSLYDPFTQTATFGQAAGAAFAFPFVFPFVLGASGIFTTTQINNNGDMPVQPVFDILGPGLDPLLRNVTQGRDLKITGTIPVGQHLIIDTDPTKLSVKLNGVSRKEMVTAPDYWNLVPGANNITFDMGATDPNTRINVTWVTRYISA